MSHSARVGLPRTRTWRRRGPVRAWWLAVTAALVLNGAVIVGLAQVSRLNQPEPPPPLAIHALRRAPPEPLPPPREPPPEVAPLAALAAPVPLALPSFDLPTASASPISLPAVGSLDAQLHLPLEVPAFAAIGLGDGPPVAAPTPNLAALAVDSPAEREGDFDLDRFFPRTARTRGVTGSSRIRSHIDAAGRVTRVEVLDSQPPGVFDHAAERLGRAQRYRPALRGGEPVPTVQDTLIQWTLR